METATASKRVYPISPIRWWVIFATWWLVTFILLIPFLGLAVEPRNRGLLGVAAVMAAFSGLILVFVMALTRSTRLEITPQGILIRQFRTQVETTWDNIESIRFTRWAEGLILKRPMESEGAVKLARFCNITYYGAPMNDFEKRYLLEEHRFMPMEVFAYWLKHGDLWAEMARHAPWLADAQGKPLPYEPVVKDPRKVDAAALTILIMIVVMVVTFLVVLPPRQSLWLWRSLDFAAGCGVMLTVLGSGRSAFFHLRKGHIFEGLFWLWLALMQFLIGLLILTGVYRQ
ncbi:MAG TPA: hypothetical protein VGZ22_03680 [Isosphaeraceae bacterium]|jgi:hypothetical protein|nr:hypothetical protein [Isosphaeraceae bacterium]